MVEVAKKPAATDRSQESLEFSDSESWSNHEEEVTETCCIQKFRKLEFPRVRSRKWPHHFHMSPAVVPHMEKVYSIVRQIFGRSPTDDLNDLDENYAVWVYS